MDYFPLLRPLLHRLPPEATHHLGLWALRHGLLPPVSLPAAPSLKVEALGLTFPNPVGLAAGFDRNAVAVNALLDLGFGFVEAGTVTPKPQSGNPKPRLFRLPEDCAVINRFGFPSEGLEAFATHIKQCDKSKGVVGVSIVKNRNSTDAAGDYIICLQTLYADADYFTVNISSPNTPGLRDLQQRDQLASLLKPLQQARLACAQQHNRHVPVLIKVAPDLDEPDMKAIAEAALAYGIDGLVVTNTTISRPDSLTSRHRHEIGGLSGAPLFAMSTQVLRRFYQLTGGKITLVGIGGISSAADAYAKIRAGATLVQLYTALVYQGFSAVRHIRSGLAELLEKDGFSTIAQAVGIDTK